jgi:hypothetical protein
VAIVYLVALDLSKNELQNPRVHNLASAPSSPVTGQIYYHTGDNTIYMWNNTTWLDLAASGGAIDWGETGDIDSITFGQTGDAGVLNEVARADHIHPMAAHDGAAHSSITLNNLAVPTGSVSFNGQKITSLGTPTTGTDGANKDYVDNTAQGLDAKASVRVATTAAGTLASSFENGDVVDGITIATNDRILIKNQAASEENGIYTVNASGAPTRATDANAWDELVSAFVWVEVGTTNADSGWLSTVNAGGTLNTTAVTFVQFSGAGQITAGTGLTKTGNTLAIDTAVVMRRFAQSVGDGAATSFNIDHNFGTLDVMVQVFRNSDGATVLTDMTRTTTNRVVVAFAAAPTSNQYRVVVLG